MIDLQMHSTASDGSKKPKDLAGMVKNAGLHAAALTDHDTIEGVEEFTSECKKLGVRAIAGTELRAPDRFEEDVDILGLFIDYKGKEINNFLNAVLKERMDRRKEMTEKIISLGYDITFEEVLAQAGGKSVGRPHIAKVLCKKYPNEFPDITSVFKKLLDRGRSGYVPREEPTSIKKAIEVIHSANGIAILAHPFLYKNWEEILKEFIRCKGDGVETIYQYPSEFLEKESKNIKELKKIVKDNNLLQSGGSDYHGTKSYEPGLGVLKVPDEFLKKMESRLKK